MFSRSACPAIIHFLPLIMIGAWCIKNQAQRKSAVSQKQKAENKKPLKSLDFNGFSVIWWR